MAQEVLNTDPKAIYGSRQAASFLGISQHQLARKVRLGRIAAKRDGRLLKISRQSLLDYFDKLPLAKRRKK